MDTGHFRKYIVRQILQDFDCWSEAAEQLLMMTAVAESGLEYIVQKNDGPARGFFQMEPWVCDDLIDNRLTNNPQRKIDLNRLRNLSSEYSLVLNFSFMVLSCRYFYKEIPEALPNAKDFEGIWRYYKRHWNTQKGKSTRTHFFKMWQIFGD